MGLIDEQRELEGRVKKRTKLREGDEKGGEVEGGDEGEDCCNRAQRGGEGRAEQREKKVSEEFERVRNGRIRPGEDAMMSGRGDGTE